MPNHCNNKILITGPDDVRARFMEGLKFKNEESDYKYLSIINSYFPIPDEVMGKNDNSWYDWAITNWGSKWGDYDTEYDNLEKTGIIGFFLSAWSPPLDAFIEISKQFPELEFNIDYDEPGCAFRGQFTCQNGEYTDDYHDMTEEEMNELYELDEEEETETL